MTTTARRLFVLCLAAILFGSLAAAQSAVSSQSSAVVPRLVNFSGKAIDGGKIITGVAGATFAIYGEPSGGSPLWIETQNIQADGRGNYTVQLGATSAQGLPLELFTSGEARWLGVRINGGEEQPRVLLLSVPYALKAADAETVGGLPPSAFMLAGAATAAVAQSNAAASLQSSTTPATSSDVTTSGGTVNTLPLFTTATNVQSSILNQTGSGTTGKIGINTATPASTLDVNGAGTIRGNLSLPATGAATTTAGKNSQPLSLSASSYNSSTGSAVSQNFRWQAEPAGNDTANASGTLNLLYSTGANAPAETGLKITKNGLLTFASGQTFPGTGAITAVDAGTDLTGGGKSGAVTLNLDTTKVPLLAANNAFAGNNSFAGTVGIGTTSPGSALDVRGNIATSSVFGFSEIQQVSSPYLTYISAPAFETLGFFTNGGQQMTITPTGVGIGTTVPGAGLDMSGGLTINGSGDTVFSTQYEGVSAFAMNPEPNSSGGTIYGNGWTLYDYAYGKWVNGITQVDGAVGINQGAPSYALDVLAENGAPYAAFFGGSIDVDGSVTTPDVAPKIDDPVDPANKYLSHSVVESSDMMNIYNGNITTDAEGNATVQMPDWFEALNRDFRYQLTVIGQRAQAYISSELANQQFGIKTDKPNVKVSWQITGIRQDAWANAHRVPVEADKPANERGYYLHPELFGASQDKKLPLRKHPARTAGMMKPPAQLSQTIQTRKANR
jgi:trimeric autotransporter adhesin